MFKYLLTLIIVSNIAYGMQPFDKGNVNEKDEQAVSAMFKDQDQQKTKKKTFGIQQVLAYGWRRNFFLPIMENPNAEERRSASCPVGTYHGGHSPVILGFLKTMEL